jgi:DNA-binding PadR family transcriptional regulator
MTDQLGEFEQIVLLAILRLGDAAYGTSIRAEIEKCTDRGPTPGAMYTTLDRLEAKGMLMSRMGDPTPERGGRAKRYFKVTRSGEAAVARAQRAYQRLLHGLKLRGGAYA